MLIKLNIQIDNLSKHQNNEWICNNSELCWIFEILFIIDFQIWDTRHCQTAKSWEWKFYICFKGVFGFELRCQWDVDDGKERD